MNRVERLRARARIARDVRATLDARGYVEVHTPLWVPGTCPDPHIESVRAGDGYLVTSTEYQLKRLFAEGLDAGYTLTQNFRAGELGALHNPEFTMVEWGRAGASLRDIEDEALAILAAAAGGAGALSRGGRRCDVLAEAERLSVADAIERALGVAHATTADRDALLDACARRDLDVPEAMASSREDVFTWLLDEAQAGLGLTRPTFLNEWPAFGASSAPDGPAGRTERSELFVLGVELGDGFPFLRDAAKQRERFDQAANVRAELGRPAVALDSRFLACVGRLPSGAGMALGFDRLVMLVLGCEEIGDGMAFGWEAR